VWKGNLCNWDGAGCYGCVGDDGSGRRHLVHAAVARGCRRGLWMERWHRLTEGRSNGVESGGRQRPLEEQQGRDTEPQGGVRRGGRCSGGG
jgi:hypothetical protein